jgi:very-short-patch-repair endonuclease
LLVVEIDGGYHLRQKDYDELRTAIINHLNIKVIRFNNEQVINNLKKVLEEIEKTINETHPVSLSCKERDF